MPQTVNGVIARSKGAPVEIVDVVVPDPGPGEAVVAVAGVRGLPHRPALPRGRHQRRLPVPARPRGRRCRRGGRRGRHRRRARRLRHPQLARGVRPVPGLPQGQAVVLLRHPQRDAEDDPDRRHRALPGARHRRVHREDAGRGRPVHQGRPARPTPRPWRLLGCGVMAGFGAAVQHRRRRPRRLRRGHRLRRGRRRGHRRRPRGRRDDDHRGRRRRPEAGVGRGVRRHAHRQLRAGATPSRRSGRSPTASAPTWSIEAVGRPETYEQAFYARDLAGTVVLVGVPTPDMQLELPLIDVFGRGGALKSSLVRRLPALAGLPDARRPVPAGPLRRSTRFVSETIGLDDVEAAFAKMQRGEVLRSVVVAGDRSDAGAPARHRATSSPPAPSPRRQALGRRQQRLDRRRRHRGASSSTPPTTPTPIVAAVGGRRLVAVVCTHAPQRPHRRRRRAGRRDGRTGPTCTPTTGCCGTAHPSRARRRARRRGGAHGRRTSSCTCCTPRATPPAPCCLYAPELRRRVQRRHALRGRAGRDRPVVQRLPDDHRVDPRPGCSRCPPTRSCTPGTASPPRSAPRRRTCRSGSPAATDRTDRERGWPLGRPRISRAFGGAVWGQGVRVATRTQKFGKQSATAARHPNFCVGTGRRR